MFGIVAAWAAEPEPPVTVSAGLSVGGWFAGVARDPLQAAVAPGIRAGLPLLGPARLEGEVLLGGAPERLRYSPRAQVGVLLGGGDRVRPEVIVGLGAIGSLAAPGGAEAAQLAPHYGVAAAIDTVVGAPDSPWLRFDLRHALAQGGVGGDRVAHHVTAQVGLEWFAHRRPPEPEPVAAAPRPAPPPPAPRAGEPLTVSPAVDVWISHPVCAWVPAAEAAARIAAAPGPVTLSAPGYLPVPVRPDQGGPLRLPEAPKARGLVVAAYPGDRVTLGGRELALDAAGDAVLGTLDGLVAPGADATLVVTGGGRRATADLAPLDGWGIWYRAPEPPPVEIRFLAGSATLGDGARSALAALARDTGGWRWRLTGSYSPEGQAAANSALAARRAEAVRDALVAGGAPADAVLLAPSEPRVGASPEAARVVLVVPLPPEP